MADAHQDRQLAITDQLLQGHNINVAVHSLRDDLQRDAGPLGQLEQRDAVAAILCQAGKHLRKWRVGK